METERSLEQFRGALSSGRKTGGTKGTERSRYVLTGKEHPVFIYRTRLSEWGHGCGVRAACSVSDTENKMVDGMLFFCVQCAARSDRE